MEASVVLPIYRYLAIHAGYKVFSLMAYGGKSFFRKFGDLTKR